MCTPISPLCFPGARVGSVIYSHRRYQLEDRARFIDVEPDGINSVVSEDYLGQKKKHFFVLFYLYKYLGKDITFWDDFIVIILINLAI